MSDITEEIHTLSKRWKVHIDKKYCKYGIEIENMSGHVKFYAEKKLMLEYLKKTIELIEGEK